MLALIPLAVALFCRIVGGARVEHAVVGIVLVAAVCKHNVRDF